MAAALVAVALTWLVPMGAARAQTVSMGRPGDHWASMLRYTSIRRDERNGVYGYKVKLRAADGCETELFYSRSEIDFQGKGRAWRNLKMRVKTGWLYYPSRLNARSLPNVHPTLLSLEESYQRLADGAIAGAQGFANVATLGTMTPLPRSVPLPRATRPAPAPARAASAGTRSAVRGGGGARFITNTAGRTLDLRTFQGLTRNRGIVSAGRSGAGRSLTGPANSYSVTSGGHALVYGPKGRLLYDVSASRIKAFQWSQTPSGEWFARTGSNLKFKEVPQAVLNALGL